MYYYYFTAVSSYTRIFDQIIYIFSFYKNRTLINNPCFKII